MRDFRRFLGGSRKTRTSRKTRASRKTRISRKTINIQRYHDSGEATGEKTPYFSTVELQGHGYCLFCGPGWSRTSIFVLECTLRSMSSLRHSPYREKVGGYGRQGVLDLECRSIPVLRHRHLVFLFSIFQRPFLSCFDCKGREVLRSEFA